MVGKALLTTFLLNKGTAFTYEERVELKLLGKLPTKIETLEEQLMRAYRQYSKYRNPLQKHIYLNNMHDKNQILFYKLVSDHLIEMLPIIYTPTVGLAVKSFSQEFRQPRGLYISYPDQDKIDFILENRTHPEVNVIVVTDGERILGMGDQGIGGIDIPIAKLMLYTICGGVNPYYTLPIVLDVGTDNQKLIKDPFYLGWRHPRIRGDEYDQFIDKFVQAIKHRMPATFLHWEDFGRNNARRILERYRDQLCTFNDDMQGTGVVTLAALLVAVKHINQKFSEQCIVIVGAGTAGVGVADLILEALKREGCSETEALEKIWLIDKQGLLTQNTAELLPFQKPYAKATEVVQSFEQVMTAVNPTILIGCSGVGGIFSEAIVRSMAASIPRPIIFPLSNPNECAEADPEDLLMWTQGKALIATGSPFGPHVAQCNNIFAFPGIGLGLIAGKIHRLTDNMLWQAAVTISECAPRETTSPLLPDLSETKTVAKKVARAVIETAQKENLTEISETAIDEVINAHVWEPYYRPIHLKSNKPSNNP